MQIAKTKKIGKHEQTNDYIIHSHGIFVNISFSFLYILIAEGGQNRILHYECEKLHFPHAWEILSPEFENNFYT